MEKISLEEFQLIIKDLKEKIVGSRINNISIINSRDFLITLSMIKNERLFISLNHQIPFICLLETDIAIPTIVGQLNDTLRKTLKDAYILNINVFENDRIVRIELVKSNDLFEKVKYNLIVECIPQRPNLIVTNKDDVVELALHYSPLNTKRPILKNLKYEAPSSELKMAFDKVRPINILKDIALDYLKTSSELRKKEKFEPLYKFIKIRTKSLTKKISVLENAIKEANDKLSYKDYGDMILAYAYDKEDREKYILENNIQYDAALTPGQNADLCFKKYKKAKRTMQMNQIEIEKAKDSIEYLQYILSSSVYYNEEDLIAISEEIMPNGKGNKDKKYRPLKPHSISYNGTKISFGKNAKTNDELTFKIASKDDYFVHIQGYHGAHVVIHNNNPSNEAILLAAEIALILSNKNCGDVTISQIKDVKKSDKIGLVNLLKYKLITINKIREETFKFLS